MSLIKITALTSQLGLSSRSLRYYEQAGLIKSVRPDFEKFRFYDEDNVERLKQIIVLRKIQVPIKDIMRVYENDDMSTVVEVFVKRVNAIDDEVGNLLELKRIVSEFLNVMTMNGITKISALPLLYKEMDKQLEVLEERKPVTYDQLSAVSEKLTAPVDLSIVRLPGMRMYKGFVCDLATNSGNCQGFLQKAQELNPDMTFLEEVREQYRQTGRLWHDNDGNDLVARRSAADSTSRWRRCRIRCDAIK